MAWTWTARGSCTSDRTPSACTTRRPAKSLLRYLTYPRLLTASRLSRQRFHTVFRARAAPDPLQDLLPCPPREAEGAAVAAIRPTQRLNRRPFEGSILRRHQRSWDESKKCESTNRPMRST